jgi:hypothetical protein
VTRPTVAVVTGILSAVTGKPGSDNCKNTGAGASPVELTLRVQWAQNYGRTFVACVVLLFIIFVVKVTQKNIAKGCF